MKLLTAEVVRVINVPRKYCKGINPPFLRKPAQCTPRAVLFMPLSSRPRTIQQVSLVMLRSVFHCGVQHQEKGFDNRQVSYHQHLRFKHKHQSSRSGNEFRKFMQNHMPSLKAAFFCPAPRGFLSFQWGMGLPVAIFNGKMRIHPWIQSLLDVPSGKRLHNYAKSQFFMGKSTINKWQFSIAMLNYQRVPYFQTLISKISQFQQGLFSSTIFVATLFSNKPNWGLPQRSL